MGCNFFPCHIFPHKMLHLGFECAKYLPQFAGKKLRVAPAITVPAGVKRQDVPVDPALAIANRFGKLAKA